ncbi:MAG: hypothetical protein HC833_26710 [Leptolyngbyaceae cyanobacterium RM1_406_9]|nr:hypothetical protein [Leptolyngbyaceae cyanobacterium RM1_406_9]
MKVLTVFSACFLVLVAFLWTRSESYFPLNPTIDTQLAEGFSEELFRQVEPGMAKAEVAVMLSGSPEPESTFWKETTWQYGSDGGCNGWCDLAWISFSVQFDQAGEVIKTSRQVFMD